MPEVLDGDWLSPTRAWRLTQCPASAGPAGPLPIAANSPAQNAGRLAHAVVQQWIDQAGYTTDDPRAAMTAAIGTAIADAGTSVPPDWTLTRHRLVARAPALVEALGTEPGMRVISEATLRDPTRNIYGTPDIVVVGDTITLIDLKTEEFDDGPLSPWITFQLSVYAHLVEQTYGTPPLRIEVFSTHRGRIPVTITVGDVRSALDALASARDADVYTTAPAEDTCRFCRRRLRCQPHWDSAATWLEPDCVEGTVDRIEQSANGLTALRLQTAHGPEWLSGIPTTLLPAAEDAQIRAIRVHVAKNADGEPASWRWGARSALAVITSPGP